MNFLNKQHGKADSTLRTSQAVPHPSTIRALCHLTSEVERDPVHLTWYGRQRCFASRTPLVSLRLWPSVVREEIAQGENLAAPHGASPLRWPRPPGRPARGLRLFASRLALQPTPLTHCLRVVFGVVGGACCRLVCFCARRPPLVCAPVPSGGINTSRLGDDQRQAAPLSVTPRHLCCDSSDRQRCAANVQLRTGNRVYESMWAPIPSRLLCAPPVH